MGQEDATTQALTVLGLGILEQRLYRTLLRTTEISARELARTIGVARTTVYSALELLEAKGLVSRVPSRQSTRFIAADPEMLHLMLAERRRALDGLETIVQRAISECQSERVNQDSHHPRIKVHEGQRNVEAFLYESLPRWETALRRTGNVWWGVQDSNFVDLYRTWLRHHWKRKGSMKIQIFSNSSSSDLALKNVPGREIRSIPFDFEVTSTVWALGEEVVLIYSRRARHIGYALRDESLAQLLRSMLSFLWRASSK